ncbi:MAG: Cna B-type domain-containing protein [Lachnospiraceae bacterium]|nr:Cna B-type domain-containing protein [Lachnospiraceae bacterium]
MIHKLLAGKGKMKRGLSLLLCLALLGGSVISANVTAEAESEVAVETAGTSEDEAEATDTVEETTDAEEQTVAAAETGETTAESATETTTEEVADTTTAEYTSGENDSTVEESSENNEILTMSLEDSDNGISLTEDGPGGGGPSGGDGGGSSSATKYYHVDLRVTGTFTYTVNTTSSGAVDVTVTKNWDDEDEENRPESVTVYLTDEEGNKIKDSEGNEISATLYASSNWTYTWEDLSLTDGIYTVSEDNVDGYEMTSASSFTVDTDDSDDDDSSETTYTGTLTVTSLTSVEIYDSKDGKLLYTVGMNSGTASDENGGGTEYQSTYGHNNNNLSYWNNYLDSEKGYWVKVVLVYSYVVTDSSGKIIAQDSNISYTYWVEMTESNNKCGGSGDQRGFDMVIEASDIISETVTSSQNLTITNTADEEIETIDISVEKVWNDNNYSERPSSITVTLYANGVSTGQTVTLDDGNDWSSSFEGLDKTDDDGNEIAYTIEEEDLTSYTSTVTGSASEGYTITNTLKTTSITVKKEVTGNMGDTTKTFSFILTDSEGNEYTLELSSGQSNTFSGLIVGTQVTLTETNGSDYETTVSYSAGDSYVSESNGVYTVTLTDDGTLVITVTNYKNAEPDTGFNLDSAPYILMLSGVMALGGAVLFHRRRRLL